MPNTEEKDHFNEYLIDTVLPAMAGVGEFFQSPASNAAESGIRVFAARASGVPRSWLLRLALGVGALFAATAGVMLAGSRA